MRVGVDLCVSGELVCALGGVVGVPSGHGGRVGAWGDSCGSVGRMLRPLGVRTIYFVFGLTVAATHLFDLLLERLLRPQNAQI